MYPGTRWVIGRAKLKTLKETTLNSLYTVMSIQGVRAGVHYKFNASSNIFTFANGSEIILKDLFLYPSDPNFDELGSLEITGAFVDEVNQIVEKAWEVLKSRIRYKLDEYGLIPKILGSCNPAKNWVFRRFYKPWEQERKGVGQQHVGRKFIQSLVIDNPNISKHYIENLKSLSDIASRERLLHGNWNYDNNPDRLCTYDGLEGLFFKNKIRRTGQYYLTADIARKGSDKAIILVWDGFVIIDFRTFDISLTTEIEHAIKWFQWKYQITNGRCIADEDGVGGGVVDSCDIIGFINNSKAFQFNENEDYHEELERYKEHRTMESFANLKSQCGYKLAQMINNFQILFGEHLAELMDNDMRDEITADLEQLQSYELDKERPLRIKPKEKIKEDTNKSPDWLDAMLFRMYFVYHETDHLTAEEVAQLF